MSHTGALAGHAEESLKSRFDRDGYLSLDRITTSHDIARIRSLLDPLFERFDSLGNLAIELAGPHRAGTTLRSPEINEPAILAPGLKDTLAFNRCKAIARELLGVPVGFLFDHAIYKLPHSNAPTGWHQDEVYSKAAIPLRSIHFWIPLQEATIENGCMWYIPGSHQLGVVPHVEAAKRCAASTEQSLGSTLVIPNVDETKAQACPVPVGGVSIHHPLTFHYAGPNRTDHYRRAWILHFGAYGRWRFRLHPKTLIQRFWSSSASDR